MYMTKLPRRQGPPSGGSRPLWLGGLLAGALIIVLILSACGGDEEPSGTEVESGAGGGPAPAAQAQDSSAMSLDEYLEICSEPESDTADFEEYVSLREFSAALGDFTERLESVEPPQKVAAWHNAVLVYQRALKRALDDAPGPGDGESEDEYILGVLFPVALQYQPEIDGASSSLDSDTLARMVAAGCIDDELAGDSTLQRDSTLQMEATELTVGETVWVETDNPDLPNRYYFQSEQGRRYLVEVDGESQPEFLVTLPVTQSQLPTNFIFSEGREQLSLRWKALTSDTYVFQVSLDDVGSYTVGIRLDPTPDSPPNLQYAWEGSTIQVSWDSVDEADYYNVYHDDLFPEGCSLGEDGTPSFCDELATNLSGTSYLHPDRGGDNYYWVTACNNHGCSKIDSRSPATPVMEKPNAPSGTTYTREGTTVHVTWNPVDGADYYKVYHDDFFYSACSLRGDAAPSFCNELAAKVTETTYMHSGPSDDTNYYWVVACNRGGCSEIVSKEPAQASP